MKRVYAALAVLLILMAGYYVASRGGGNGTASAGKTAAAPAPAATRFVSAEGKVEAMPGQEVEVGSELDGRLTSVLFEEGSRIRKGDLLATIENREIQARLAESEAELRIARSRLREVLAGSREEEIKRAEAVLENADAVLAHARTGQDRYRSLFKDGVASREMLEDRERNFKVAQARMREADEELRLLRKGPRPETVRLNEDAVTRAEAAVSYYRRIIEKTQIVAPISGKVIRRYLHPGEMVSREQQPAIVAIADVERLRINAEVDETDIGRLRVGDAAEITTFAYPDKVFHGVVREISDYIGSRKVKPNNPARNLDMKIVQVKIDLEEKTPLKLGMTVDVMIRPEGAKK